MLRREFLLTASLAAGARPPYRGLHYRDYSRCWPETLRLWAEDAARKRDAALARIRTAADAGARQKWARATFWSLLGGEPQRTPLNIQMRGEFARGGYRVEKLTFESFPGIPVPANLYVPTGRAGPFPGVLFQCGHSLNGKSGETYQRCCQGLAKLGFLTLTIDPMGQGERTASPRQGSWLTRLGSADEEHNLPGRQMLLLGDTCTRHQLWDTVRAFDVLAGHPLVDPMRIGVTGQSGGGTLSMFLAAVDSRPAAIAVSSGNTENFACIGFDAPGSTDDAEQNFPGGALAGFDRWDTLYPFAPRPLLILVSAKDYFGTYSPNYIRNGWGEFEKLRRFYSLLGGASRIEWEDVPVPHALGYEARLRVYNWLLKWLQPGSAPLEREPAVAPERDEVLWVSEKGSVLGGLARPARSGWIPETARPHPAGTKPPGLADLLALSVPPRAPRLATLATSRTRAGTLDATEVQSGPAMWIPAWLARSDSSAKPLCAVVLDPSGRNSLWQEGGILDALAMAGWTGCAPDLRGIGDLRGEYPRGSVRHAADHATEEAWAWAGLWLGRPVVGQRVSDILALVRALLTQEGWGGHRIFLAARGHLTVPALLAAHFEPAISGLYLSSPLWSFRSIVDAESYTHPLGNFVAGVLHTTDLPEIARAITPRPIVFAGALTGGGVPVPGGQGGFHFLPEPDWTPAGIVRRLNSIA